MDYIELIEDGIRTLITRYPNAHRGELHLSPDVYTEITYWGNSQGEFKGELTSVVFCGIDFKIIKHPDKINFYDVSISFYEEKRRTKDDQC